MKSHEPSNFRNPSSFVTYRLARLQNSLNAQATLILKETAGLFLVEWRLIQILRMFGSASLTEIATHMQIDKGQLSRKIHRMIDKGLLTCERDENDSRVQNLKLTKTAIMLSEAVMPVMEKRQRFLLENVNPEDLAAFYRVVEKLEVASKNRKFEE